VLAPWSGNILECGRDDSGQAHFHKGLSNLFTKIIMIPNLSYPEENALEGAQLGECSNVLSRQMALHLKEYVGHHVPRPMDKGGHSAKRSKR
jgi:hypothetical protein